MNREEKTLTTDDILNLSDLSRSTLQTWCNKGTIQPLEAGAKGGGHSRQFSLMQGIGIIVANELKKTFSNCDPAGITAVVDCFDNVNEKWLQKEFEKGKTHFIMPHYEKPLLDGLANPNYDWPDVQEIYNRVKEVADQKGE